MKIAILTLPLGHNYGGIMQTWALQQVLKRMGHEPLTIDRQPDAEGIPYRIARLAFRAAMKSIGQRKGPIQPERFMSQVTANTRAFISRHLAMSPPLHTTEKLKQHFQSNTYDAVIVGSDQVWRPAYSPNIYNFFLDFLPDQRIKKIAYASSFGVDHWEFTEEQTRRCEPLAKKFDLISVREISGIKLCQDYLDVEAHVVLDPTLLLSEDDYLGLLSAKADQPVKTGVYTYFLDKTVEKQDLVRRISKHLGMPSFKHQALESIYHYTSGPMDEYVMPPVEEWLSGFKQARFVITDSFHGMVFAIIFKKPFIVINNKSRGSARFSSLLSQTGLLNQLIENTSTPTEDLIEKLQEKNYENSLTSLREFSLSILNKYFQKNAAPRL